MRFIILVFLSLSIIHAQDPDPEQRDKCCNSKQQGTKTYSSTLIRSTPSDNLELPELSTQAHVYTARFNPQNNKKWVDNCLNINLDIDQFGCRIVAYRIQWFSGAWSGWFVPGVNDLYKKQGETLRRYWACFNDHSFEIIYQTSGEAINFNDKNIETVH